MSPLVGPSQALQVFNSAALQAFLDIPFFKVSGCFSDTVTRHPTWKLRFQNILYLMHLEKNIKLSQREFCFISILRLFHLVFP